MAITLNKKLLISSLLPQSIIDGLRTEDEDKKLGEAAMCATSLLIVNIALGAVKALEQRDYKALDANPGDAECQARALELRRLIKMDLKEECSALAKVALGIKNLVNIRKGSPKDRVKCTAGAFFQTHFGSLNISNEIEYIMHCYLSKVLRAPYHTHANGVIMTKSDISKLEVLSEKIQVLDYTFRRKILEENQKTLSMLSVAAMRVAATQVVTLESEEKELMITMLSPQHTHIFTPDIKYEPKSFGCLFYEMKTVLLRLREEQGIVCLKSIVATGRPFHLLFQSQAPGQEFEILPDEAYTSLSPMTAIVVFDAVVNMEKEAAGRRLLQDGFTHTMLVLSANAAPYEPKSTLDDVKVPKALEEIKAAKAKSKEIGEFITLDHIYLNTLGAELKSKTVLQETQS